MLKLGRFQKRVHMSDKKPPTPTMVLRLAVLPFYGSKPFAGSSASYTGESTKYMPVTTTLLLQEDFHYFTLLALRGRKTKAWQSSATLKPEMLNQHSIQLVLK